MPKFAARVGVPSVVGLLAWADMGIICMHLCVWFMPVLFGSGSDKRIHESLPASLIEQSARPSFRDFSHLLHLEVHDLLHTDKEILLSCNRVVLR